MNKAQYKELNGIFKKFVECVKTIDNGEIIDNKFSEYIDKYNRIDLDIFLYDIDSILARGNIATKFYGSK